MNRKYLYRLSFFACLLFLLLGCKKTQIEGDCFYFTNPPVTKIEGATTGSVNQEIELKVFWISGDGCGMFWNFEGNISGNTTTVIVKARHLGCTICSPGFKTVETLYKFKKSQTGTYELRFLKEDNSYLTHTIIVL